MDNNNMMKEERSTLISLYQIVVSSIEKYEATKVNIPFLSTAILGTLLGFFVSKEIENTWIKISALLFLSLIATIVYYIFSFSCQMSSVLQGYAAYLEDKINQLSFEPIAHIFSSCIDEYIIPKKFRTNRPSFLCMMPLVIVVHGVVYVVAWQTAGSTAQKIVIILAGLVVAVANTIYILDCKNNDTVRCDARKKFADQMLQNRPEIEDSVSAQSQ